MKKSIFLSVFISLSSIFWLPLKGSIASKEVSKELIIYSARKEHLLRPVIEAYKKLTGVQVHLHTNKAPILIEKLKREGASSPADIFMTVDVGHLTYAAQKGLLKSLSSNILMENIPAYLRHSQSQWWGFSLRARLIFYNPHKVSLEELSDYMSLSSKSWQGRLCLRTSRKVYNQSLVAFFLARWGEELTRETLKSFVGNLASKVFTSDTKLLEAIHEGTCHVGIANSYYYGRLLKAHKDLNIKPFWPSLAKGGVHMNISGAGILKTSQRPQEALKFLEWLSSPKAQKIFADVNMEYPVHRDVSAAHLVQNFSENLKIDTSLSLEKVGELQSQALRIIDQAKYE